MSLLSLPGNQHSSHIAVLGLGYVGCVTAACLARLGHKVVGVDRDEFKVRNILAGTAPFYEPGLEDLVSATVAAGSLTASTSLADALPGVDIVLICVGTPSARNGNLGIEQLRRVVEEIADLVAASRQPLTIAVRSTVYPGTCEEAVQAPLSRYGVAVVSNPEFLREGSAVKDFMEPSAGGGGRCHLERSFSMLMDLPARRLGIFGLAFKENTDDLRESPVVTFLEQLIGKGRVLRVFDPQIVPERIYGSNQRYLLAAIPHIGRLFDSSLEEMLDWADHVVVAQKPSREYATLIAASGLPVTDLVSTKRARSSRPSQRWREGVAYS